MKKGFAVIIFLIFIFSCKNDKEEIKISYVKIECDFDTDGAGPEYKAYLFDIDKTYPKDGRVHVARKEDLTDIVYMKDVNDEFISPIYSSKYSEKPNKDNNGKYINNTSSIIYWFDLPSSYKNIEKCNFVIALVVQKGQYSFKQISWGDNSTMKISKTFKRDWDFFDDGGRMEEW